MNVTSNSGIDYHGLTHSFMFHCILIEGVSFYFAIFYSLYFCQLSVGRSLVIYKVIRSHKKEKLSHVNGGF